MHPFVKNALIFVFGFLILFTLFTFGMAYIVHKGGFRWLYQFFVSMGLLACAFYFFVMSKGNVNTRIVWGLVFLVLSPLAYCISNAIFWSDGTSRISLPRLPAISFGRGGNLGEFLMRAQIANGVPVALVALIGFLVGNGIFVAKGLPSQRRIGGNILLLAWVVLMYWMAASSGRY